MSDEIPKRAGEGRLCSSGLSQPSPENPPSRRRRQRDGWQDRRRAEDIPRVLEGFKSELHLAGVKIPCAVINGPKGIQRVLTENGITYAILGERSGASKRLKKAASEEGALLPFLSPRASSNPLSARN